jgi:ureidoacrylate peracid hydrolase
LKIIFVRGEYGLDTSSPTWERRPSARKDREEGFRMCEPGSWGAKIIDQLKLMNDDIVVVKHRHSAFVGTSLEAHLRRFHAEKLIFTGIMTNVCVESSVRDAFNHDYDVIVVEDCVAGTDRDLHAASLKTIARHIGTVSKSEEIIKQLTR